MPGDAHELAIMMAGARARGVADALEMLGLPAILLDIDGFALHISGRAAEKFGARLAIVRRRLVAGRAQDHAALRKALGDTLGAARLCARVTLGPVESPLCVALYPAPAGDAQLLGAVAVLIDPQDKAADALVSAAFSGFVGGAGGRIAIH
ncbi:MAG: hypothetical protein IPL88_12750 [Rhizobiales bacterium]|nr:hypothetical protein [Hyphomicrobiales bacterium]